MAAPLRLQVTDYENDGRWRFRLDDGRGAFLADHEVRLAGSPRELAAWRDLPGYLEQYRRIESEGELLARLGEWLGREVWGPLAAALAAKRSGPATVVEMEVPEDAQDLLFRPFELAHVAGRPLAAAGVRLVYRLEGDATPRAAKPAGDALRLLAVFSLPSEGNPLNLRRERAELAALVERLAQKKGVGLELRVLQYGSTRAVLREALLDGRGWDLVHFSGHGLAGELILEDEAGSADAVDAGELAALLRPAGERLQLLTLSACLSGAASLPAARKAVGLDEPPTRQPGQEAAAGADDAAATRLPSLAQRLAGELDCAVVAMRYSVGDDFARECLLALYDRLLDKGQPLPAALQLALDDTLGSAASGRRLASAPPLSLATPILFGPRAAELTMKPPKRTVAPELPAVGLLEFPPSPERFVGRLLPMLAASCALAPEGGPSGVLFHGMAGAGKTACAVELAFRHEQERFTAYAWFKAPDEGTDIAGALTGFALALERQLGPQLGLVGALEDPADFPRTLLRLKGLLQSTSLLLVIDNLESLLTASDGWRDPRWGELIAALLGHQGLSRLVLTSRRVPAELAGHPRLAAVPVHALSFPESVLLARELPGLAPLFAAPEGRQRLRRILAAAQGHPKLLELAAAQEAADPAGLDRQLRDEEELGEDPRFFADGETGQGPAELVRTLAGWTAGILRRLPPTARLLFAFLSRLEEEDRQSWIVEAIWKSFLVRLEATDPAAAAALQEPGEELAPARERLAAAALVEVRAVSPTPAAEGAERPAQIFRLHPALAEAGRQEAGSERNDAVDRELGDFWVEVARHGLRTEMEGGGRAVVQSGPRGAPYWLRAGRWEEAATYLEGAILRDASPATLAAVLPLLRRIVAATRGTERELIDQGILATALRLAGRSSEAEALLRDLVERGEERGQLRQASGIAGHLLNLLRASGRYREALALAGRKADLTRRAGLGPWTQMSAEGQRLQILAALGRHEEVLAEVERLRDRMATLLESSSEAEEAANPWNVREVVLDTGRRSAQEFERWELALEFNEELCQVKRRRGADAHNLARARFNDYGPLLSLGRLAQARQVLESCRRVFEEAEDLALLGRVYGALADLEDEEGDRPAALQFQAIALRYSYQTGDPEDCAISHHNLANYLERSGAPPEAVAAQRWAAGAIRVQVQSGLLASTLRALAARPLPPAPPAFAEVAAGVEALEGVRFRELFARLPATFPDGDAALAEMWQLARERQARGGGGPDMEKVLREAHSLLRGIAQVARGDEEPRVAIEQALPQLEADGWQLSAAVARIWAGERDAAELVAGVDSNSARLLHRVLELIELPTPEEVLAAAPEAVRAAILAGDEVALKAALEALPPEEVGALVELLGKEGILGPAE